MQTQGTENFQLHHLNWTTQLLKRQEMEKMKHPRETVMTGSRLYSGGKPVYYYCTLEKSQILVGTCYYKQETAIFTLGYTEIKLKINTTWNYQHPCWEGENTGRMYALRLGFENHPICSQGLPSSGRVSPSNLRCWGDSESRGFQTPNSICPDILLTVQRPANQSSQDTCEST